MTPGPAGRLAQRLLDLASLHERRVVGLMSGTSSDGVDAALVRIAGSGPGVRVEVVSFLCHAFPSGLADRIAAAPSACVSEIARLGFDLGEAFAEAALAVIAAAGLTPADVHLVGSHGQTVWHEPPPPGRRGDAPRPEAGVRGATLQLGEGDVIAQRTGVVTVSDFRTADVAAGGHGAPLIPLVDWLVFRPRAGARIMLNVGGIANLTRVTPDLEGVRAFDTGPGNALMDAIVAGATGGRERMDRDGARAARGRANEEAVQAFMRHPYFAARPPKSTGKETFGDQAAGDLARLMFPGRPFAAFSDAELSDLLATAAAVTARSVAEAVRSVAAPPEPSEVVVSGGGTRNAALMRMLAEALAPCPVRTLEALGMDPDAKEAMGFAVLANETIAGRPGNLPAVTGASRPVVLGKISAGF